MKRFGHEVFTPGLQRTKPLYLTYIDWIKSSNIPIVTIAGTNGKGETAYSLEWLLCQESMTTALWTSPHILSVTERFSFDGKTIEVSVLNKVVFETFIEIDALSFKISFYEFLFLIFLKLSFRHYNSLPDNKKDKFVLILEVGLGGRLDAVNHFDADIVCLTSISRDHKDILGNTYRSILSEKCGVLRSNCVLLSCLELAYLRQELQEILTTYASIFHEDLFHSKSIDNQSDFSFRNRLLAYRTLELILAKYPLRSPVKSLTYYLNNWPLFKGRSEFFYKNNKKYIFIGAHNVDGMRKLVNRYQQKSKQSYLFLSSFSKRDASEVEQMLLMLTSLQKEIVVTVFRHPKAFDDKSLKALAKKHHRVAFKNSWKKFLKDFNEQEEINEITITGSYYFIGEVQSFLQIDNI